jgi:hypothetical protein
MGCALSIHQKECRKSLGCALSTGKYGICFSSIWNAIQFPIFTLWLDTTSYSARGKYGCCFVMIYKRRIVRIGPVKIWYRHCSQPCTVRLNLWQSTCTSDRLGRMQRLVQTKQRDAFLWCVHFYSRCVVNAYLWLGIKICNCMYRAVTYLLTSRSRVLLEKLTSCRS